MFLFSFSFSFLSLSDFHGLGSVIGKYSQLPDSGMVYRQICIMWEALPPGTGRLKRGQPGPKHLEQSCCHKGVQGETPLLCSALRPHSQAGLLIYVQPLQVAPPPHGLTSACQERVQRSPRV